MTSNVTWTEMDERVTEPRSDRECEGGNVTWRRANQEEDSAETTEDAHACRHQHGRTDEAVAAQSMEKQVRSFCRRVNRHQVPCLCDPLAECARHQVQAGAEEKQWQPRPGRDGRSRARSDSRSSTGKGKHYVR